MRICILYPIPNIFFFFFYQKSLPNLIMLGLPNQGCIKGTDGSSCEYFIRMAPNLDDPDFLDIYMEGNLKGWVAVGFSHDTYMVNYYQTNNNNYNITRT